MEIRYTKYGLAGYYGDHIEINEKLKDIRYTKLHGYILNHELKHSNSFDLIHDLKLNKQILPLISFMLKNPKTWTSLIPIEYKEDTVYTDWNQLILYFIVTVGLVILYKLLLRIF